MLSEKIEANVSVIGSLLLSLTWWEIDEPALVCRSDYFRDRLDHFTVIRQQAVTFLLDIGQLGVDECAGAVCVPAVRRLL